ncbi:hypothetical protein [Bacteroides fluxus]|uniref:hypothetical protein n=1 Tax=Bacteroides fluxus TaxID=626930 RepID=UPI002A811F35|nr:hypothetical protein [Bacteroides fluxus]
MKSSAHLFFRRMLNRLKKACWLEDMHISRTQRFRLTLTRWKELSSAVSFFRARSKH